MSIAAKCEDMFICQNQRCINKTLVCDSQHIDHCGDWSDEYCLITDDQYPQTGDKQYLMNMEKCGQYSKVISSEIHMGTLSFTLGQTLQQTTWIVLHHSCPEILHKFQSIGAVKI